MADDDAVRQHEAILMTTTMRAVVLDGPGAVEHLEIRETPT